jgi:hypothetical protein
MTIRFIDQPKTNPYGTIPTVEQVIASESQFVTAVMKQWNPDNFNVVEEPSTWESRWGGSFSDAEWELIVTSLCAVCKSNNQNTNTWVTLSAGSQNDLDLTQTMNKIGSLDGIGYDLYGDQNNFESIMAYMGLAKQNHKRTGVMETWLEDGDGSNLSTNTVTEESLWLSNTFTKCLTYGFTDCYLPWWTQRYLSVTTFVS